jgi:hypothetical protein
MTEEPASRTEGSAPDVEATSSAEAAQPGASALEEALSLIEAATERGIPVRLVGGLAVQVLCPNFPPRVREAQDLDLASVSRTGRALTEFLEERGYVGDKTFNALYGRKQLFFSHGDTGRTLDVMVDRIEMCHTIEFKDRIEQLPYTLDLLDLLMSKLQIIELNEKDAQDVIYLLSAYRVGEPGGGDVIDLKVFRQVLGDDWGWWRTVTMNLDRIRALLEVDHERLVPANASFVPVEQLGVLHRAADEAPKSFRWKMRSRVGDRVRWYQEPEESVHH